MVVPTGLSAKKAHDDFPYKVSATDDPEVQVKQPTDTVVWGVWSSGLGVAVISAFIFPFIGVPAVLVAIFSYVDHKTNDQDGYKRKRKIARRLGAVVLIVAILLIGIMFVCKIYRWHKYHPYTSWCGTDSLIMPPPNYCHRPNRDCYGRDIRHYNGSTLRQCQQECDWNQDCLSIQYNRELCWLKDHRCTDAELRSAPGANDYFKPGNDSRCDMLTGEQQNLDYCARPGVSCEMIGNYCHRPNSDCASHDLRHQKAYLKTCLESCDLDSRCRSIQHRGDDCWIKNYVCNKDDLTLTGGLHDYVKRRGPGESCNGL